MARRKVTMMILAVAVATIVVPLASPAGASTRAPSAPPSIRINDIRTNEGDPGMHAVTFKVRLSEPSGSVVTVALDTVDRTATEGEDYLGTSTTLTFLPGQTLVKVHIQILGDTEVERNETFIGLLSTAMGATIAKDKGRVTIVNDD
jgi:hypothetical protein